MPPVPGMQLLDPMGLATAARAARPALPQVTPEQEESLLGWAGSKALSGLEWLGLTLDKSGAAVRGTLAGQPEALLNLIPFSDTMGLTDPDERVWGRELLEMAGAPRNRPGLFNSFEDFVWDVLGLGTEVVTDPLMLVRGPTGALTSKGLQAFRGIKMSKALEKALPQFQKRLAQLEAVRGTGKTVGAAGGKQFQRTMGRTMAEKAAEIRTGERALLGFGLPGMAPFATFGKGEWAAKAMEKAWYSPLSAVPWLRYAFSHKASGVPVGAAQMAKDAMFSHAAQISDLSLDIMPAVRREANSLAGMWDDLAQSRLKAGDQMGFEAFTRDRQELYGELIKDANGLELLHNDVVKYLDQPVNTPAAAWESQVSEFSGRLHTYLNSMMEITNSQYDMLGKLGANAKHLEDIFMEGYHPRRPSSPSVLRREQQVAKDYEKLFGHAFPFASRRNPLIREFPGRTHGVNQMAMDKRSTATRGVRSKEEFIEALREPLRQQGIQVDEMSPGDLWTLADQYSIPYDKTTPADVLWPQLRARQPFLNPHGLEGAKLQQAYNWHHHIKPNMDAADLTSAQRVVEENKWLVGETIDGKDLGPRIERVTEYFSSLPPEVLEKGLFDRRMVEDLGDYVTHISRSLGTVLAAHHFLAGPDIVWRAGEGASEGVGLKAAWNQAGLSDEGLANWMRRKYGDEVIGPLKVEESPGKWIETGERAKLNDLMTDERTQGVLNAYMESMRPLNIGKIGQLWDKTNSLYKGWFVMAPAFHTRNLASGIWQWWAEGVMGIGDVLGGVWDAARHVHSRGRQALSHIDELADTDLLRGAGGLQVAGAEVAEEMTGVPEGFLGGIFQPYKGAPPERLAGSPWRMFDPTASRGVRGVAVGGETITGRQNIPSAMGEKAYSFIEFLLRAGPYDRLRKLGYSPSQARHITFRTQFDYSQASKFEQQVMTRLVPFWRWARNNIPRQIELVVSRPGGRAAQTNRLLAGVQRESGEGGYLPPWMRERMAARVGGTDEAATFLTQAGLPLEDLTRFQFTGNRPSLGATARRFASDLHPLLLAPVEAFAGKQVWTGRKLKDLRPITGQPAVDFMLARSPFSRQIFESRRALDTRKSEIARLLDLTTGLKFHTVDLPASKLREMERIQKETLQAHPDIREFAKLYVPKAKRDKVDPEVMEQLSLLNLLIHQRKALQQQRK